MSTESGVSIWRVKPVKDAMMQQADNPGIRMSDDWKLSVTSNTGEPVSKDLPVFYLPRTLDPVPHSETATPHASAGSERILVVEDNEDVRRAVVDMLKGWGYRVVAVQNPDAAVQLLAHLFQHQIHHRGQAHAMLAGTTVEPPQLDEFFCANEAHLRAAELAELGLSESAIWGKPSA